jgi:Domain of unknown function (DUF4160)
MPVFHREGPYAFLCFANERGEPAHVHVRGPKRPHAKFWLVPRVSLANPGGYNARELREMYEVIEANRRRLLKAWNAFHRT